MGATAKIQVRSSLKSTDGIIPFIDTVDSGSPTRIEGKDDRSEHAETVVRRSVEMIRLKLSLVPGKSECRTNEPNQNCSQV
jgi:hypothetical protein